jgi:hypothetical protein
MREAPLPLLLILCQLFSYLYREPRGGSTHLIRFWSFSASVMAATSAAARSGGDKLLSHTLLLANRPFLQSGNHWKALFWAAARPAAPTRTAEEYLMTASNTQDQKKIDTLSTNEWMLMQISFHLSHAAIPML